MPKWVGGLDGGELWRCGCVLGVVMWAEMGRVGFLDKVIGMMIDSFVCSVGTHGWDWDRCGWWCCGGGGCVWRWRCGGVKIVVGVEVVRCPASAVPPQNHGVGMIKTQALISDRNQSEPCYQPCR